MPERIGLLPPSGIGFEPQFAARHEMDGPVRPVAPEVAVQFRAAGQERVVLDRGGRRARQGHDGGEVDGRPHELDDQRLVVQDEDAGDVVGVLEGGQFLGGRVVAADRRGVVLAVLRHAPDRAGEVGQGGGPRERVRQPLQPAHDVVRRDLPRGRGVPEHAAAQVHHVVGVPRAHSGVVGGRDVGREVGRRGDGPPVAQVRCGGVAEQLPGEQPDELVGGRLVGGRRVEAVDGGRAVEAERPAGPRQVLAPRGGLGAVGDGHDISSPRRAMMPIARSISSRVLNRWVQTRAA